MSAPEVTSLGNTVPGARALAEAVLNNPSIQELNKSLWIFSVVETAHLLFLTTLGGATLVLALRVLGVALLDVTPAEVERATRPWLRWATLGGIASGIFMSIATVLTLIDNSSFVVKLLALGAAVTLGFALSGRLRGGSRGLQYALATVGLSLLSLGIWLFISTRILVFGSILLGTVAGLFLLLVLITRARGPVQDKGDRFAQLLAIGTVVAWTTVILGGRWIGFS